MAEFPKLLQFEFTGVELWFPPLREGAPPAGHVGLRFLDVVSACFYTRREATHFPENWPDLMSEDRLEALPVWNGGFSFNDDRWIRTTLKGAGHSISLHGPGPLDPSWHRAPIRLAFGAGPVMAAVAAERLVVRAHGGEIPLGDLEGLHGKWWTYCREYWKKRGKREALPYDPVCEVVIPPAEKRKYEPVRLA